MSFFTGTESFFVSFIFIYSLVDSEAELEAEGRGIESLVASCKAVAWTATVEECAVIGGNFTELDVNHSYRISSVSQVKSQVFSANGSVYGYDKQPITYSVTVNVPVTICGNSINILGFTFNINSNNKNCGPNAQRTRDGSLQQRSLYELDIDMKVMPGSTSFCCLGMI